MIKRLEREYELRGSATVVGAGALGAKALGFVEKLVLAQSFGVAALADIYLIVTGVLNAFYACLRELVESVLVPALAAKWALGQEARARRIVRSMYVVIVGIGTLAMGVLALCSAWVPGLIAPGMDSTSRQTLGALLTTAGVALPLLAVSAVLYGVLCAACRFRGAVVGDVVAKLVLISACTLAAWRPGYAIALLAAGIVCSAAARMVSYWVAAPRWSARGSRASPPVMRKVALATAAPVLLGVVCSQLGDLVETGLCSYLPAGAISARAYARRIIDLAILMMPYALSVASVPRLSRLFAGGESAAFSELVGRIASWTGIILTPLSVLLAVHSVPIVRILFEHGAFSLEASRCTATMLFWYALGLPILGLEAILVPAFYAQGRMWPPTLVGLGCLLSRLLMIATLAKVVGVAILPIALVASRALKIVALARLLKPRMALSRANVREAVSAYVVPLAIGMLAMMVFAGSPLGVTGWERIDWQYVGAVVASSVVFVVSFMIVLLLLPSRAARMLKAVVS